MALATVVAGSELASTPSDDAAGALGWHRAIGVMAALAVIGDSVAIQTEGGKDAVMRRFISIGAVVAAGLGLWGCSGNGYAGGGSTPTSPTPPATSDTVTIDVVAINGEQSFSPNPATVPAGRMVVWRNVDNTTHRVVLNDRSVDTGNLAPGASSQPMALNSREGGPYHCTIHPEMVGRLTAEASAASCQGPYCP